MDDDCVGQFIHQFSGLCAGRYHVVGDVGLLGHSKLLSEDLIRLHVSLITVDLD